MAFNGSGTHVRVHDWTTDLSNTVPVTASRMDAEHDDVSTALSNTICRDGQSTTTARIPFASGTSAAAGSTSAVSYAQTNDTNTGLYFPSTDQWGLVAGGTATLTSTATKLTAAVAVDFTGAAAPTSSDGAALGSTSQMWSDLFLASGAVINWNNGDVTLTHSANALAWAGASSGYTFDAAGTFGGLLTVSTGGAAITGNSTVTGTLGVSGNFAINTNKFNVTAASGDTTVAGTLGVTGATTLSAGLTVSGGSVDFPAGSVADSDLASPGAMKLILKQTASASATVDFTQSNSAAAFDGTYDRIVVVLSNVKVVTDGAELHMRIGTGAGPTYQTANYNFSYLGYTTGTGTLLGAPGSQSAFNITDPSIGVGNASGEKLSGRVEFDSPDASDYFLYNARAAFNKTDGNVAFLNSAGVYNSVTAITALRFMASTGNIASGTFVMYGVKDA